jgi:DNA repair protein RecN (Recombination protein N)
VEELALMLRGESRSETTRKEAAEMLRTAEKARAG